ncbi:MAG TPA: hypothetical protein VMV19_12525, partial [Xanthobacteraceae bacterium]|nr:hypothetical protein [Xanthobacteraceae bacterium]
MYQPNLSHVLAKSTMPRTVQDYNAALASAGGFLAEIEKAHANPLPGDPLAKTSTFSESTSPTSGLTYYDLELGAKFLYPLLTPLRNEIPRVSGKGGIQANWRVVTGVNTTGLRIGVSGGNRGGVQAVSTQDYSAAYKGIGIETSVDFEAQYAGMGFDDVKAIGAKVGLEACMLGEELLILGGNTSVGLGATPTPSLAPSSSGGALTAAASPYSVICVALSLDGIVNGSVTGGIQGAITRANADGSSDTFGGGAAQKSTNATTSIASGTSGSIAASVAPVIGALGYAWFWGAAGSEVLGAITTINSLVMTANAAGTQTAASLGGSDNSTNALVFDGLLYQALKSGSNAYVDYLATGTVGTGSTLTGDGAGGIVEIDAGLKNRWDNYRLSPDTMWVSSQVANNLSAKILAGGTNAAQRFVFDAEQGALGGGVMVRTYLNKFSMAGPKTLDIRVHPNMPAGTILMTSKTLPYPLSNVGNVMQLRTRQDYYQIEWPPRARRYETGVYADEVLQHYFPPSMAVIS